MREKICGIYKITSLSGRIYIGQAIDIHYRFSKYRTHTCKSQKKLYNSLVKHGVKNHKFEIIESCNESKLDEREIYWINFFDTFNTDHGLNLQSGGYFGSPSYESKLKIGAAAKGRRHSKETKEKLRIISLNKNFKHNEEFKNALSLRNIGNKYSLGRRHSDELKLKISQSHKNSKKSQENSQKIGVYRSKLVINTETGIFYESLRQAHLFSNNNISYEMLKWMLNEKENNKNRTSLAYA